MPEYRVIAYVYYMTMKHISANSIFALAEVCVVILIHMKETYIDNYIHIYSHSKKTEVIDLDFRLNKFNDAS